ncbi:hypothetical protein KIV40_15085 [Vibrio sp. D173a]|uniref:hypothetical protein n=1 Tax=Vibrio sp. D173a TaxID=2836349 RepID=UPI0025528762|nr:hypothetical protein [Vibrio sp. D173a]MDK9756694.1 hypothetical protein [Vibrio sp. D173a]
MDYFLSSVFIFFLILFISFLWFDALVEDERIRLMDKYNNKELVDKLMMHRIWQGQTEEQLLDSIGQPSYTYHVNVKRKILRYEYTPSSVTTRFQSFNVTIVDGTVVATDRKQPPYNKAIS